MHSFERTLIALIVQQVHSIHLQGCFPLHFVCPAVQASSPLQVHLFAPVLALWDPTSIHHHPLNAYHVCLDVTATLQTLEILGTAIHVLLESIVNRANLCVTSVLWEDTLLKKPQYVHHAPVVPSPHRPDPLAALAAMEVVTQLLALLVVLLVRLVRWLPFKAQRVKHAVQASTRRLTL